MGVYRQRLRRTSDRHQWEKDRALLPEHERRTTGATERDTGLTRDDLEFQITFATEPAGADLARRFGVARGTLLLRRAYRTRRRGDTAPLSLITSRLPYDLVAGNPDLLRPENEPWPGGTHHQLSTIGVEIDRVVDEVTVRRPRRDEAKVFGLRPGTPVLVVRKTSIDTTCRVVEVAEIVLPGDRTELVSTTRLHRWPPSARNMTRG
ncbi:transcriptional regulator [Planotetraspora thailandica]|uniref:Transcriptional regulator n=1 Tax=Planotetraspora thailandica TaxID=487172 RepID=A0A8J3Y252_9ACTN|nr:UTRA domain-containing protein [Planotetraspora thailandica]GII59495.1 transcriptional regulator [Planotetraspora thailandica]